MCMLGVCRLYIIVIECNLVSIVDMTVFRAKGMKGRAPGCENNVKCRRTRGHG